MPPPLFFDLATINLEKTVIDRSGIAKLLPHRDHLALIDAMLVVDLPGRYGIGRMDVPKEAFWTSGHFPGNPILPGVVLVEASAQVALVFYKLATPEVAERLVVFGGIENVRFRGVVRPGDRVLLLLKMIDMSRRGARAAAQAVVNGRLVFEGEILAVVT